MIWLYILECSDGRFYTGITSNPIRRLYEHQNGLSLYTKSRLPVRLVYFEKHNNYEEARKREVKIKDMSQSKKGKLIEFLSKRFTLR